MTVILLNFLSWFVSFICFSFFSLFLFVLSVFFDFCCMKGRTLNEPTRLLFLSCAVNFVFLYYVIFYLFLCK